MFDPFDMDDSDESGFGFGGFGFSGPNGFGQMDGPDGMYEFMDPYGDMEAEPDEHEEKMMRVANCLGLFPCEDFAVTLQNACYMCNVNPDEFDEDDVAELRTMVE